MQPSHHQAISRIPTALAIVQGKPQICDMNFKNKPPYSCEWQIPKYSNSDKLALSWSNSMMLWSVLLSGLVFVLRRLPGGESAVADGGEVTEVQKKKTGTVV